MNFPFRRRAPSDRSFLRDNLIGESPAARIVRETIARVVLESAVNIL
jgi:hypothetical protein